MICLSPSYNGALIWPSKTSQANNMNQQEYSDAKFQLLIDSDIKSFEGFTTEDVLSPADTIPDLSL